MQSEEVEASSHEVWETKMWWAESSKHWAGRTSSELYHHRVFSALRVGETATQENHLIFHDIIECVLWHRAGVNDYRK